MTSSHHIPILLDEIDHWLTVQDSDVLFDATLGFGGHARHLTKYLSSQGVFIGTDLDPFAIKSNRHWTDNCQNMHIFNQSYTEITDILKQIKRPHINKIVIDLGLSSYQLDGSHRGFQFQDNEPLDMRFNPEQDLSAADILNTYSFQELSDMFYLHSNLHQNKKLSQCIIDTRKKQPLTSTAHLIDCIKSSYFFRSNRRLFIKTCSQVFQAIRMEVNQELTHIRDFLNQVPSIMAPNGRIALITFHSVEDKLVKQFFTSKKEFKKCNKKVIRASQEEIQANSRSKSAKLRVYEFQPESGGKYGLGRLN